MTSPGATIDRPRIAEVRAAGLAAIAESALLYLPLTVALTGRAAVTAGSAATYPTFVAAFTLAVVVATRFRGATAMPTVAAVVAGAVGLLSASLWGAGGSGGANEIAATVIVALLLALRVVTLALREWRDPIQASFGWGAVALLGQVLLAAGIDTGWEPLMLVAVPQFFLGSLASRAASVRATAVGHEDPREGRAAGKRQALIGAGALGAFMAVALAIGGPGGLLERLGALLTSVMATFGSLLAFALAQLARPIFWLVDRLNIDPTDWQRALDRIRVNLGRARRVADTHEGGGFLYRAFGVLALVGLATLLVWAIRKQRTRLAQPGPWAPELETRPIASSPPPARPSLRLGARRGEMPADTVRRWYAESLMLLEGSGVAKPPWQTPGEFLPDVTRAFPDCAGSFAALTRAYEEVRYGNRTMDRARLKRLEPHRELVMRVLRQPRPVEGT
ncbi:MAG: DUF4129 domain-containing protein [Actinomycetota bacterium]